MNALNEPVRDLRVLGLLNRKQDRTPSFEIDPFISIDVRDYPVSICA